LAILPNPPTINTSAVSCIPFSGYTGQGVVINWVNPPGGGAPVSDVDISSDPNFTPFYTKGGFPGVSSTNAPDGFHTYLGATPFIMFGNTTYYVHLYNGSTGGHSGSTSFSIPICSSIPGDINGDGVVNIFDYNILVGNFGKCGTNIPGDIDGNGCVNIFDYNILVTNFGKKG
jgi:hypothetical protein